MLYYVKLTALLIKTISRTLTLLVLQNADIHSLMRCAPPAPEVRLSRPKFDDLDL